MEQERFAQWAVQLRPRLVKVGRDFFGHAADADDVAQETLLRLWRVRGRIDEARSVKALAVRLAKNYCVSLWRRRQCEAGGEEAEAADLAPSPAERLEEAESLRLLRQAIDRLPRAERRVFLMRQEDGLTAAQIAAVAGMTERSAAPTPREYRDRVRRAALAVAAEAGHDLELHDWQ